VLSLVIGNLSANHNKQEDTWKNLGAAEQTQQAPQPEKPAPKSEDKIPD
jgi:preprotein translocase subunit SecG